jgi:FAD:protein FMN transferase
MRPVHRFEEQWGTVISVDVRDLIDVKVVDRCFAWFGRVDDLFSTWRPDTEIMRIARGELAVADSSAEMKTVLELCEDMRLESAGAFDISFGAHGCAAPAPGRAALDPSGVVKGWAVARAGDIMRAAGASNFFVNAGGDVLTAGCADGATGWRVGIQHPWERDRVAAVLEVSDAAVATSGRYERGDHVFDPRTGRPATGLASVTVVGPDLALADAFATAAVVLGPDAGMRWLATRVGYDGMGITDDREVVLTPSFDRHRVS